MTDTGQVPGEGQPESAGMVEQPGVAAHGAYTYLSEAPAEDEELLLPGAQGAWGNEVPPPAPEPVLEAVHEPGPHETAGRDSGSVDLGGVRLPDPAPVSAPAAPVFSAPQDPQAAAQPPRRPLHLGPPIPDASASPVRSLADRGPAGAPVRQPAPAPVGPEYLDAQPLGETGPQNAVPWGTAPAPVAEAPASAPAAETVDPAVVTPDAGVAADAALAVDAAEAGTAVPVESVAPANDAVPAGVAVPAEGVIPAEAAVPMEAAAVPAEAAVAAVDAADPSAGADQAAVAPVARQTAGDALAAAPVVHGHDGVQPAAAHDGVYVAPAVVAAPEKVEVAVVAPESGAAEQAPAEAAPVVAEAAQPAAPVDAVVVQPPEEAQAVEGAEPVQAAGAAQQAAAPEQGAEAQAVPVAEAPVAAAVPAAPVAPAEAEAAAAVAPEAVTPARPEPSTPAADVVPPVEAVPAPEQPAAHAPEAAQAAEAAEVEAAVPTAPAAEAPAPAADVPAAPEPQPYPAQGPQLAEPVPPLVSAAPEAQAVPEAAQPAAEQQAQPAAVESQPQPEAAAQDIVAPGPVATPEAPAAPAGAEPEPIGNVAEPQAQVPAAAEAEQAEPLPSHVAAEPRPEQPLGQFVAVDGQVPTTPHLAPTPPYPLVLPTEEPQQAVPTVPAPREGDQALASAAPDAGHAPDVVQHAEDLRTRAADQEEEDTAAVAEARQPAGPAAPGYDDAEREAVLKVMRERRDIRNGFRSDPIPHEVLLRVLEAAHTAPSVGHSQPWDFVVIRSADTRRTMHELAMRQRDAYAKSLPKGRAKQFKELKIEAILDTPVNIVVTADPTRGGRHTLGRHTQPQMAPYSSALAVENLWLAARAEGLGVGWVSFFDEREMVRALGLPEHLEVVAYLCVGYVDEFPDEPELMQAGWSKRRPLSWVVHEETYGRRALPGEEPHDLLAETVAQIRPLDAKALGEAWERQKRMTKPAGALGMLEIISAQLSGLSRQCPPPIPEPAAVAIFAGDHGVHAQGVTPWPQEVTAQMVANFLGGGAVCNAFAAQVGAEVCVVDVGVAADLPATPGLLPRKIRGGTSDMTTGPAMTREEAKAAIEVGIETARDLVAAGNKALLTGEMGIANTTASAALISVYTGADPAEVTGRGTGINDETLARKTEVVRRALELHQPDPADPLGVLAALGGFEHAAMVGLLLGGASLRTPVILDGVSAGAAALVARAIAPEVLAACIAGHRSAEPGHVAALNKLGLRPLVDLDLRLGEGTGALLALPLVQSTARAMHEVATFDSAGVTEK
ncbi:nicotinate-nucleotide--dimethylbenzimidazole phosphoribosyltransferase [Streptomyces monashensis]|uniref:Nicotinate-nucleotide--dimethylbenzimidazole phosphoribosyltransferase n=1 Tax=Streptomyces monashensis TaxID=1678012 RepID=A0A1S2QPC9_9ACTN|nr:nicotinate-nucleotide--dimethylbenzimidazole phosphoribosyltransferase [Streptomyces monashensis]OIK08008.1 5,6-dimethylbenzimidazole synthase [Streptomyces monashensis]